MPNSIGFNTLEYHIAQNKQEIGCISKSMTNTDKNNLIGIVNYLHGCDNTYNPVDKSSYSRYTFSFIERALKRNKMDSEMQGIISTIIFDSLIGNGDRHQENWGFIVYNHNKRAVFSPIYDSGSCLGRELSESRVIQMLNEETVLNRYIEHDKCEVRWIENGKKISHFSIIDKIKSVSPYSKIVVAEIKRLKKVFNEGDVKAVVDEIDKELPANLAQHKLTQARKNLMVKFVAARFEKLKKILE